MKIKTISFVQATHDWRKCPAGNLPEYAFIGRSNVGKSSLINMLANNNGLAKISSKPGKTQSINHFIVNNEWYLVDLPGYGFAHTSKTTRENWSKMIRDYFVHRQTLLLVFVLIDSRIPPQQIDIDFINGLGELGMPFSIIFTKSDKVTVGKVASNMEQFKQKLLQTWEELPPCFVSSALTGKGREEILNYIDEIQNINNQQFEL